MKKQYATDRPCSDTQLRNPVANKKTGRHHCKECEGFTVKDLEGYARRVGGIVIERGDTKQDLCNKIFERVGLRGQNIFDKIVSGAVGIPPAEQAFLAPPAPAQPQAAFPFAAPAPAPVIRSRVVFQPVLMAADRPPKVTYPPNIEELLVADPTEYQNLDRAIAALQKKMENFLKALERHPVALFLDHPERPDRPMVKYESVLKLVEPATRKGKPQSFFMVWKGADGKENNYLGKIQFKVTEKEAVEEVKPVPVEEVTDEMLLRLALDEGNGDGAAKKRGLAK